MNQRKEEDTTEADFIIRSYTKAELAQLYCPGLDPVLALQKLYRWMRKNTALTQALWIRFWNCLQKKQHVKMLLILFET